MLYQTTFNIPWFGLMSSFCNLTMTDNTIIWIKLCSLSHCWFCFKFINIISSLTLFYGNLLPKTNTGLILYRFFTSKTFNIFILSNITIFNCNWFFHTSEILLHLIIILCCIFNSWVKLFCILNNTFYISTN